MMLNLYVGDVIWLILLQLSQDLSLGCEHLDLVTDSWETAGLNDSPGIILVNQLQVGTNFQATIFAATRAWKFPFMVNVKVKVKIEILFETAKSILISPFTAEGEHF